MQRSRSMRNYRGASAIVRLRYCLKSDRRYRRERKDLPRPLFVRLRSDDQIAARKMLSRDRLRAPTPRRKPTAGTAMTFATARTRSALSTPFCRQTTVASGLTNRAICVAVADVSFALTQKRISEQSRTALISTVALDRIRSRPSALSRTRPLAVNASAKCFRPMKRTARQRAQTFHRNSHPPRLRPRLRFVAILEFRSLLVCRQHDLLQSHKSNTPSASSPLAIMASTTRANASVCQCLRVSHHCELHRRQGNRSWSDQSLPTTPVFNIPSRLE